MKVWRNACSTEECDFYPEGNEEPSLPPRYLAGSLIPGRDLRGRNLALPFTDLEIGAKEGGVASSWPLG